MVWILEEIKRERYRQDEKWGPIEHLPANRAPDHWIAILTEEVGEVARASLENDKGEYIKELTQVAAVCVSALEHAKMFGVNFNGVVE